MLISKTDLYKTEWLDLVFDDRNKNYGAYELRQHYAGTIVKAMSITFSAIAIICGTLIYINGGKEIVHRTHVDQTIVPPVVPAIKQIQPPHSHRHIKAQPVTAPPATTRFVTMAVKPVPVTASPPKIVDLGNNIGPETVKGPPGTAPAVIDIPKGPGGGEAVIPDDTVHPPVGLDVMPEPVGGINAWSKFLSKNLRFPAVAQEENISGKVLVSFIIEKDGQLSHIVVDRGAGHGFDEEALRVLKLAKAWKPGMQNGQAVRVKYTIPINFQLSE